MTKVIKLPLGNSDIAYQCGCGCTQWLICGKATGFQNMSYLECFECECRLPLTIKIKLGEEMRSVYTAKKVSLIEKIKRYLLKEYREKIEKEQKAIIKEMATTGKKEPVYWD